MKFAVFALFMLFGAIACQTQSAVETCITDLKQDAMIVDKLVEAFKTKNVLQIIQIVTASRDILLKTKEDCKLVNKQDVLGFVYSKLSTQQKECLSTVLGVAFSASTLVQDLKNKDWESFFANLRTVTENVETSKNSCQGLFKSFN